MNKLDDLIEKGLSAEDRELLARHAEPGYVAQAFGIFRGPWSWVMWLTNLVVGLTFFAALYAFWQVYLSAEVLHALKWGVAGLLLVQVTAIGKIFMGVHLEANRMLREIKRVDLQIALLRGG